MQTSVWLSVLLGLSHNLHALPIGFGTPPAGQEYYELKSKDFYVYHDKRAPHEARLVLNSLEYVRPTLERWFSVQRTSPLPVIVSATTSNASFANFITDAVELQTLGLGTRDLVWHEFVHSTMYRHFDNWLGPAGSILHLLWLPSWYVEGLAEAMSVSIGSGRQTAIERYYALTGDWPSYDRLHSLYSDADFSFQGYAISGAFVSYILRQGGSKNLPKVLDEYAWASMPWYWAYSLFPFENSLPLDEVLNDNLKKNGPKLYKSYRKAAEAQWQDNQFGRFWHIDKDDRGAFGLVSSLQVQGNDVLKLTKEQRRYYLAKVNFKDEWAQSSEKIERLPEDLDSTRNVLNQSLHVYAIGDEKLSGHEFYRLQSSTEESMRVAELAKRSGSASDIYETRKYIVWREHRQEKTRLCLFKKSYAYHGKSVPKKKIACPIKERMPRTLEVLGVKKRKSKDKWLVDQIWIKITEQTKSGDRYSIIRWTPDSKDEHRFTLAQGGEPQSVAFAGSNTWVLVNGRSGQRLQKIDDSGRCLGQMLIANYAYRILGLQDESLVAPLFMGNETAIIKIPAAQLQTTSCSAVAPHTSPLLAAMAGSDQLELSDAMEVANPWRSASQGETSQAVAQAKQAAPLDKTPDSIKADKKSRPAKWRGRPIFGVPWLGADVGGMQLGILSVPLMDHMQNEEIRAYLGYGINSRFPHTELSFRSTRFWPTLQLDVFRYQTWDGRYLDSDPGEEKIYRFAFYDEKGARFTSSIFLHSIRTAISLGHKSSNLKRYVGPSRSGNINEPFTTISQSANLGGFTWSNTAMGRVTPAEMNEDFEYNQLGFATALARRFSVMDLVWQVGAEGSRTRGKKTRNLREFYRPLKIFVPGAGTGFNNLFFPLLGNGGLFSARYGDNQGRVKTSFSFPIVKDMDKLVRFLYWKSVEFTAFYNYGGAWYGGPSPESEDLIAAHGYNTDFLFDVKGFKFHYGYGIGQVFGSSLEFYAHFSFDAIF